MPVEYCPLVLPALFLLALVPAFVGSKGSRRAFRWVAGGIAALFLFIYFAPGWVLWPFAAAGNRDAQFALARYNETRLSYLWTDREERAKWYLAAAQQGHPEAMLQVGHNSMYGTSQRIPKDYTNARRWLEAARDAHQTGAAERLRDLDKREVDEK